MMGVANLFPGLSPCSQGCHPVPRVVTLFPGLSPWAVMLHPFGVFKWNDPKGVEH